MGLGLGAVTAPAAESQARAEYDSDLNPYLEHAPLAFFSLGSLAVGGIFYGIQSTMGEGRVQAMVGDKSQMNTAIAAAGATALISAFTYFYYAHRDVARAREALQAAARGETGPVSAGVAPDGSLRLAATLRLPSALGL